jgi:prepilin-type N-terminal cleavage/methylation domain-containing protein
MRRRAQGFTLIEIMVVIAIIAGLISTVVIVVPKMQENQKKLTCQQNLSGLGKIFVTWRSTNMGKPPYDGQALFLSWRTKKSEIRQGDESVLICPGDQNVVQPNTPEAQAAYNDIDLKNPPTDKCSYAVRNFSKFPFDVESPRKEPVASDRQGPDGRTMHHRDGIVVCFDDAACKFMTREELGIATDSPIVVGPDASHEDLKKLIYNVQTKE